jgi:putative membrane protein
VTRPPRPFLREIDEAADPSAAPPVPDAVPEGQAMQAVAAQSQRRGSAMTRFALWAFGALFTFVLSVSAYDFVTGLLARNLILGWAALALFGVALLAGLVLGLREWAAFLRLERLDGLRSRAETARAEADLRAARRVVAGLTALYSARGDTAWGRARLAEREGEVMDADALLSLAERELLTTLDAEAQLVIEGAARQVATVTALVPLALADVATAAVANLRMIRRIAEIYGGRSGSFGSLKLLRRVFGSLVAAGALALTDDMIGSVAGGGVLSKLSRRFGEGVVNGALTARVGVAAMELCRPMPFVALERPAVSSLVSRALAGLVPRGEAARR